MCALPARSTGRPHSRNTIWSFRRQPLPRTRTTNVIFDRSGEGLTHGPIPADVRMETIRGSPQAVRIPGIRDGGVGIAKRDPEDLREVLDPRIEAENVPGRASRSDVVGKDGSGDGHEAGIENGGIYRREVTLDRLRSLISKDVVHSRQDDRVCGTDLEDVSREPIANFLRGLAVDPPVQDGPFRMGSRHPVFVLALWIPIASRRRFEGRAKTGGARGRGVAEADDSQGPRGHGQTPGFTEKMLTIAFVESLGAMTQMVAPGIRTPLHREIARTFIRGHPLRPAMVRAVKPTRKRDGRLVPPQGYPKNPEKYADPANWKYPVHTPFHARAARRYFNEPRNRANDTPEEQAYIDKKINEALERFGVAVKIKGGQIEDEAGTIQADVPMNKDIDKMTFEELLQVFLGTNRLASAKAIDPSVVSVDKETDTLLGGRVKEYSVRIDRQEKRFEHDCVDFKTNRATGRLMCKHLGAFLMQVDRGKATHLLRDLLRERDRWTFE